MEVRWEFESLHMADDKAIDNFAGRVSTIVNKLRDLGKKLDEEYTVKKKLYAVSSKFIQIASTIEEFSYLKSKTMEKVISSLKTHEEYLHSRNVKGGEYVLLTCAEWKVREKKVSSRAGSPREYAE